MNKLIVGYIKIIAFMDSSENIGVGLEIESKIDRDMMMFLLRSCLSEKGITEIDDMKLEDYISMKYPGGFKEE